MSKREELMKLVMEIKIEEEGFIKVIDRFNEVNINSSKNTIEASLHLITLLYETREIVIKRNKPEEIGYFNTLLSGCFADISEHLSIEHLSIEVA